ncbi:MAG: hypothetical protein PHV20_07905 [Bacteroidales bacterium]|nr:hypothetical protein [Bacteroidales bacterium]
MAKETYSIPVSVAERYEFQRNEFSLCVAHATAWQIPAEKLALIEPLRTSYEEKYALAANRSIRSPATTAARDAAWNALSPYVSDLYDRHLLYNENISAADKEALHIRMTSGGGGSPSPAPTSTPIVNLSSEEISVLHVNYTDSNSSGSRAKPANVVFAEIWYKIDVPAPTMPDECPLSCNISRSHDGIVFSPEMRGKTMFGYARWVNRNGKVGPWGGLFSAIIP